MRASYDLSPNAEVFASLIYSAVRTENIPAQGNSDKNGMTMRCDNAFLYQTFQGTAFGLNGASPSAFAAGCGAAIGGVAGAAAALPAPAASAVRSSVGSGAAVAGKLASSSLLDTVRNAFVHGMDLMLWTCGGIAVACALLALIVLRRPAGGGAAAAGAADGVADSVPGSLPVG